MIFATSYPFLNIFWTMIIFFAWVIFIWIAITILIDLFRRHDVGGWMKALWCVIIIIFPFIGVLLYLIIYHDGMNERRMKDSEAAQASFDQAVRQAAATGGPASEIETGQKLSTPARSRRPSSTRSRPRRSRHTSGVALKREDRNRCGHPGRIGWPSFRDGSEIDPGAGRL